MGGGGGGEMKYDGFQTANKHEMRYTKGKVLARI